MRCPRALLGAAGIVLLTACGTLEVAAPEPSGAAAQVCDEVLAALPHEVAGQEHVEVETAGAAAAWGDPAVVLRCGVPRPDDLSRSSQCFVVEDVGWFSEPLDDGYRFTTIGREVFVELVVPGAYAPEADALVDVAEAVGTHDPVVDPCE